MDINLYKFNTSGLLLYVFRNRMFESGVHSGRLG